MDCVTVGVWSTSDFHKDSSPLRVLKTGCKQLNGMGEKVKFNTSQRATPCMCLAWSLGPQGDTLIHDDTTVTSTLNNLIKLSNSFLSYASFAKVDKNKRKWKEVGTCQNMTNIQYFGTLNKLKGS